VFPSVRVESIPDNVRHFLEWVADGSEKGSPNKALQQNRDDVLRC
jgi:hypothetical protein